MKKYLMAGLIILLPLALTLLIIIFIVDLFTSPFLNWMVNYLTQFDTSIKILSNPGFVTFLSRIAILVLLVFGIFLLGVVARWFFFKSLINLTNKLLSKIPFIKGIYRSLSDIFSSFMSQGDKKAFQKTAMVAFPSKESYCVGFVSGDIPNECQKKIDKKLVPIFLPTAPHPISGYLVMVKEDEVFDIEMSNEDAVKFTVSCGLILPGEELPDEQE